VIKDAIEVLTTIISRVCGLECRDYQGIPESEQQGDKGHPNHSVGFIVEHSVLAG